MIILNNSNNKHIDQSTNNQLTIDAEFVTDEMISLFDDADRKRRRFRNSIERKRYTRRRAVTERTPRLTDPRFSLANVYIGIFVPWGVVDLLSRRADDFVPICDSEFVLSCARCAESLKRLGFL